MSLLQIQHIIDTSSDDAPNVTLVTVDKQKIRVHKSKLLYYSKLFSDELTEKQKIFNCPSTMKEILEIISHIYKVKPMQTTTADYIFYKLRTPFNTNRTNLDIEDDFTDVTLVSVDGQQFKSHKAYLRKNSSYFRKNLKDESELKLKQFNGDDVGKILSILYNKVPKTEDDKNKFKDMIKEGYKHCTTCSKDFMTSDKEKKMHEDAAHGEPHKCPHCDKIDRVLSNLKVHIRNKHKILPLTCKYCDKKSESDSEHRDHVYSHQHEYPNSKFCMICCELVKDRHNFSRHMNRCQGVYYQCDYCKKEYTSTNGLKGHIQKKHKVEYLISKHK